RFWALRPWLKFVLPFGQPATARLIPANRIIFPHRYMSSPPTPLIKNLWKSNSVDRGAHCFAVPRTRPGVCSFPLAVTSHIIQLGFRAQFEQSTETKCTVFGVATACRPVVDYFRFVSP